jgi:hypothetical protein
MSCPKGLERRWMSQKGLDLFDIDFIVETNKYHTDNALVRCHKVHCSFIHYLKTEHLFDRKRNWSHFDNIGPEKIQGGL